MIEACYNAELDFEGWNTALSAMQTAAIEPFVQQELRELEFYDATRPAGHPYAFPSHVRRVAGLMDDFARFQGFSPQAVHVLATVTLVHDCGKRFQPVSIWDTKEKPDKMLKDIRREHTVIGSTYMLSTLDKTSPLTQLAASMARYHHEAASGAGYLGLKLADLSLPVRMLVVCDSFDGWRVWRPSYGDRDISPKAVLDRMTGEKAADFDPTLLAAFARMVQNNPNNYELTA